MLLSSSTLFGSKRSKIEDCRLVSFGGRGDLTSSSELSIFSTLVLRLLNLSCASIFRGARPLPLLVAGETDESSLDSCDTIAGDFICESYLSTI